MVLLGRRRRHRCRKGHLGVRHGGQRWPVWPGATLCQPQAARGDARARVRSVVPTAGAATRGRHHVFRVRRYRGDSQLRSPGERSWLDGRSVPGSPPRSTVRDRPPRPPAPRERTAPEGGARGPRREHALWRVLPAGDAFGADRVIDRRSLQGARRDRHDQVRRPCLRRDR